MRQLRSLGLVSLLVLSTAIATLAGDSGAAAPAGWTSPHQLGDALTYYEGPADGMIAVGANGRALAAWDDYNPDSGFREVYFQWHTPSSGWGEKGVIWDFWGDDVLDPSVAASANGDFFLVCEDRGGIASPYISAWHYDASASKWEQLGAPHTNASAVDVIDPRVAMDGNGNAVVVWRTTDDGGYNLTANRYTKGAGWDVSDVIIDNLAVAPSNPRVVMDPLGTATAAWQQSDGGHVRMFTSQQDAGGSWSTPQAVDGLTDDALNIQLAVDMGGNVVATYLQYNGTNSNIYAVGKARGAAWVAPQQVSTSTDGAAGFERVGGGTVGGFVVAWNQFNGVEYQMTARVLLNNVWTAPVNLSVKIEVEGGGTQPFAAMDASGNALVMWQQYAPDHNVQIWAAWWTPTGGWAEPGRVDESGAGSNLLAMAMDPYGHALAIWGQGNGYGTETWGAAYSTPDTTPPALFAYVVGGETTTNSSVVVEGSGSLEAGTSVNGVPAYYVDFGIWHAIVPVHPGNNSLSVSAHDAAGNYAYQVLYVDYNDPVPGLLAQIAAAQADAEEGHAVAHAVEADLDATKTELDATQHDLNTTQTALASAQTEIAQLRASQNTTAAAQTAATTAAANAAGSASMLGLLGVIVGIAGAGIALMAMRKPKGGMPAESLPAPSTPASSPPPPPAEPPK